MKKVLLFSLAIFMGVTAFSQGKYTPVSMEAPKVFSADPVAVKTTPITAAKERMSHTDYIDGRAVTFVPIGSSGNAYGFYSGPRTYVWADDRVNSVVLSHRMVNDPPTSFGNSRLAYDVSWNGGDDGTWTNNVQVYEPTGPGSTYPQDAGRYPQGGIINPPGNTDPANAYYTYFAALLSNVNSSWGGYGYGINPLTQVDPPMPTQNIDNDPPPPYRAVPDAFHITQDGVAWMIDQSNDQDAVVFMGEYWFYRGEINEAGDDIEYEFYTQDVLEEGDGVNDSKVAFDPSGEIGYLCVMSDVASDPTPFTNYHPILYMTEDGGETWSEDPIHAQFGGPDGIEEIKNYLPDDILDAVFPDGWDRETVAYNMGFHVGMAVDYKGNPHLTGLIAPGNETGWFPNPDVMGTFHLWYDRETQTWDAKLLYMNRTMEGVFGEISMYNRPYTATDMDGRFMFFTWLDTDQDGVEENVNPDIYLVSYDMHAPEGEQHSEVQNVTAFTQAMWSALWGTPSYYVFEELVNNDTEIQFEIPFVYEELTDNDPTLQVEFWYMDGYTLTFPNYWVGVEETQASVISNVKQNYPNPFNSTTKVEVKLENAADLSLEVVNLVGQKVMELNRGSVNAGSHVFEISADKLQTGVYFYTVKAGNHSVTKKMIVE